MASHRTHQPTPHLPACPRTPRAQQAENLLGALQPGSLTSVLTRWGAAMADIPVRALEGQEARVASTACGPPAVLTPQGIIDFPYLIFLVTNLHVLHFPPFTLSFPSPQVLTNLAPIFSPKQQGCDEATASLANAAR